MGADSVMEGHGRYNAHAAAQAAAGRLGLARLAAAARAVPSPAGGVATIADYGASQGGNSMAPMRTAIEALRDVHGPELPIRVVHTDLPGNDFSTLFETVRDASSSYAGPGVFTFAVGRSFYEQLMPAATVTLGWCSIALHWLSAAPAPLRDGVWYAQADGRLRAAWARRAAEDWVAFLDAREAELAPGARVVVVVGAADPAGHSGAEGVMAELDASARAMVRAGTLTEAEYAAAAIPAHYRALPEWLAPFPRPGLQLEHHELIALGDPLWPSTGPAAYARELVASLRTSFGAPLLASLSDGRREEVAAELFDHRLAAAVRAEPASASPQWRLVLLVLRRAG